MNTLIILIYCYLFENFDINQVLQNIIGGIIVAIITVIFVSIKYYFRKRKFKYILGNDADKDSEFHLVYAKLELPAVYNKIDNDYKILEKPYFKTKIRKNKQANFSMSYPVSSCEVRALKYLTSSLFSQFSGKTKLVADIDECVEDSLNISYISLGGPLSNYKTEDLLSNEGNRFLTMGDNNFYTIDKKPILKYFELEHDYGIIIKIHPIEFPNRVWIACTGLGEWGTSGAAWYLSNKCTELLKKLKNSLNLLYIKEADDFAALIKVKTGQDESAKLIAFFKSNKDILTFINNQKKIDIFNSPITESIKTFNSFPSASGSFSSNSSLDNSNTLEIKTPNTASNYLSDGTTESKVTFMSADETINFDKKEVKENESSETPPNN